MGPVEILLIVLAIILIFGARRLPELGRGIGQGVKEFRRGVTPDESKKPDEQA